MSQTTHQVVDGRYVQIVTPEQLRAILDADGDDYSRPDYLGPDDQWEVAGETSDE